MGGGISMPVVETENFTRSETETEKQEQILQVEQFLLMVQKYSDRVEGVWLLLASDLGQKHLYSYLAHQGLEEILEFFQQVITQKASRVYVSNRDISYQTELKDTCLPYYEKSGPVGGILRRFFTAEMELLNLEVSNVTCDAIMSKILIEVVNILAEKVFLNFLQSSHYSKWRAIERSHAVATKPEDSRKLKRFSSDFSRQESLAFMLQKKVKAVNKPIDLAFTAMKGIHEKCGREVFDYHCEWLLSLLSASEVLPISMFVCSTTTNYLDFLSDSSKSTLDLSKKKSDDGTSDKRFLNFPLFFVNKYFQTINKRKASSVLGKTILDVFSADGINTEEVFGRLFDTKKYKNQVNVEEIVLLKKDESHEKSFIAVKPVYNHQDELCYFIGLQLVEGKGYDLRQNPKILLSLWLDLLPKNILPDDEE